MEKLVQGHSCHVKSQLHLSLALASHFCMDLTVKLVGSQGSMASRHSYPHFYSSLFANFQ